MLARHQVAKDKSPDDFLPGGGGEWDKQLLPGALNNNFSMDGNGETTISETISYRKIWIHWPKTTIYKWMFQVQGCSWNLKKKAIFTCKVGPVPIVIDGVTSPWTAAGMDCLCKL